MIFPLLLLTLNVLLGLAFTFPGERLRNLAAHLPLDVAIFSAHWASADVLSMMSALWTVQAALAALIYPIVIAFVALLLQQRRGTGRRIEVFLDAASAITSSLSAIGLIAALAAQYGVVAYLNLPLNATSILGWFIMDLAWFALNLVLIARFTVESIWFLRPDQQRKAVLRYIALRIWPSAMQLAMANAELRGARLRRYLHGRSTDDASGFLQDLFAFELSARGPGHKVFVQLGAGRWLTDINTRTLKWAIALIHSHHRRHTESASRGDGRTLRTSLPLGSPMRLNVLYKGSVPIFKADQSWTIGPLARALVRRSFVFSRRPVLDASATDFVSDAIGEAIDAIASGESGRTEVAFADLVAIHGVILALGENVSSTAQPENLTLLPFSPGLLSRPGHEELSFQYIELFDSAVNKMPLGVRPVALCASLVPSLLLETLSVRNVQVRVGLLRLATVLGHALGRWWLQAADAQGKTEHSACVSVTLEGSIAGQYDEALRSFIGQWEQIARLGAVYFLPDTPQDWTEYSRRGQLYVTHLFQTAAMLALAVSQGDAIRADWLGSTLQGWSSAAMGAQPLPLYLGESQWVSANVFWSASQQIEDRFGPEFDGELLSAAALRNTWEDVRCIVAYMLIEWGQNCDEASFAAGYAGKILSGAHGRGWGAAVQSPSMLAQTFDEAIVQVFRQSIAWPPPWTVLWTMYPTMLDSLTDLVRHEIAEPLVPGRLQVTSVPNGLQSLRRAQVIYLLRAWRPGSALSDELKKHVRELAAQWLSVGEIETLVGALLQSLAQLDANRLVRLVAALGGISNTPAELSTAIDGVRSTLQNIIEVGRDEYRRTLDAAQIDEQRLRKVGEELSNLFRAEQSRPETLGIFASVSQARVDGVPYEILVSDDVSKGEFTTPPLSTELYSKPESIIPLLREAVRYQSLRNVLIQAEGNITDGSTVGVYARQVAAAADEIRKEGLTPIVVADAYSLPEWFITLQTAPASVTEELPAGMQVVKSTEPQLTGYRFHMGGVPVFTIPAPLPSSYVLAFENFSEIVVIQNDDDSLVRVQWVPSADDRTKGSLSLRFALLATQLRGTHARIRHQ